MRALLVAITLLHVACATTHRVAPHTEATRARTTSVSGACHMYCEPGGGAAACRFECDRSTVVEPAEDSQPFVYDAPDSNEGTAHPVLATAAVVLLMAGVGGGMYATMDWLSYH